jgi:hypothetical protein
VNGRSKIEECQRLLPINDSFLSEVRDRDVTGVETVEALSIGPFEVTACVCGDAESYGFCKCLDWKSAHKGTQLWLAGVRRQ